ncbi:O-antigen ligase family protein [Candidatus Aerophobetes bacterium]|nr:O-antigen ligase family protein [Candidatus Aerophobetes bacterium]
MKRILKKILDESLGLFIFFLPWLPIFAYLSIIPSFWKGIRKINFKKNPPFKLFFFDYALISFFLAVSFSVIFSTFKILSLGAFVLFILYLAICLLTREAARNGKSSELVKWFFYSGLIVIFFGILQYILKLRINIKYFIFNFHLSTNGGITSTLGNPNRLAEYLLLLLPLVIARFLYQDIKGKIISGILVGGGVFLLFLTRSVGGVGALTAVILIFIFLKNRKMGIAVFIVLVIFFFLNYKLILEFINQNSSLNQRIQGWENIAFPLIKDHFLLGSGLATYRKISYHYSSSAYIPHSHAHSIYLNYLCEIGILGASTLFLSIGVFIKKCLTLFHRKSFFVANGILIGFFLAILGALIYGTVETFIDYFQLGLLFWAIIGMGVGTIERIERRT